MTIWEHAKADRKSKIRAEMLRICKDSIRKSFPLLNEAEVRQSAARMVAEALAKENHETERRRTQIHPVQ